jgi:hypothetical protein
MDKPAPMKTKQVCYIKCSGGGGGSGNDNDDDYGNQYLTIYVHSVEW